MWKKLKRWLWFGVSFDCECCLESPLCNRDGDFSWSNVEQEIIIVVCDVVMHVYTWATGGGPTLQRKKCRKSAREPSEHKKSFRPATNMDTWTLPSSNPRTDLAGAKVVNPLHTDTKSKIQTKQMEQDCCCWQQCELDVHMQLHSGSHPGLLRGDGASQTCTCPLVKIGLIPKGSDDVHSLSASSTTIQPHPNTGGDVVWGGSISDHHGNTSSVTQVKASERRKGVIGPRLLEICVEMCG